MFLRRAGLAWCHLADAAKHVVFDSMRSGITMFRTHWEELMPADVTSAATPSIGTTHAILTTLADVCFCDVTFFFFAFSELGYVESRRLHRLCFVVTMW